MPHEPNMTHPTAEAEDWLRLLAYERGISRRRFLQLLSVGGAAAVLAACFGDRLPGTSEPTPASTAISQSEPPRWYKDPTPFIQRSGSLEARLENLQEVMTPNKLFFVRNNSTSMDVDATTWRLSVEGDAVSSPMELSYSDIQNMPSSTLALLLWNARATTARCSTSSTAKRPMARSGSGEPSATREWIGVLLRDVLTHAGIIEDAAPAYCSSGWTRILPKTASGGRCR